MGILRPDRSDRATNMTGNVQVGYQISAVQRANNAIRMMIGIGTPSNQSRMERIVMSSYYERVRTDESRRRPPKVAARLAMKAPMNNETTSHNAVYADALRASSATCFALSRAC
jgi:hypothetical protein